jgi:hypothetical protein
VADLGSLCRYSPIRHTQINPTERVMCELAIHEPCMAESAGQLGYTVQIFPYPSPAKQPYEARYARAEHGGKLWPIWLSSADTPLSVNRRAILTSALCASLQFARPACRKVLADLDIQCRYSSIHHTKNNLTEHVMCEQSIRETYMAESAGRFLYPVQELPYPPHAK